MTGWAATEAALNDMLARRWYTNHGPVAQALERQLATTYRAQHAIVATNPTIALVMLLDASGLTGRVLLASAAPRRCWQAIRWAGLQPCGCDVFPGSPGLSAATVAPLLGPGVSAILLSGSDDDGGIAMVAHEQGVPVLRDGAGGRFGPEVIRLGACGEAAGIACILTDDDAMAARLRNIRSSYGAGPPIPVLRTANGRVSEAQAAMAMLDLDAATLAGAR